MFKRLDEENTLAQFVDIYNSNMDTLESKLKEKYKIKPKLVEVFTSSQGQSDFTLTKGKYERDINDLVVYVGGVIQLLGSDYNETSSSTIHFNQPLDAGLVVVCIYTSKEV